MSGVVTIVRGWLTEQWNRGLNWMIGAKRATYGASVARIIYGLVIVLFVVSNFSNRNYLWGSASGWTAPIEGYTDWAFPFTFYNSGDPDWLFTLKFLLLGLAGLSLALGWHARISAIVVLYLFVSLVSTNSVATDQTDNALRIILFYFVFTDLSGHWSLDARRRRRRLAAGKKARGHWLPDWFPTILHNGAIIAVALQIFIIYVVAGLSKVKGSQWQDGTAVYYPLRLDSLSPWPAINDLLVGNGVLVNFVTYFAVFIQLFFPFLLLTRWTRVIALVGIVSMHAGIGILMGLPLFSMAMMAADGIFIRDATYAKVERAISRRTRPWLDRVFRRDPRPDDDGQTGEDSPDRTTANTTKADTDVQPDHKPVVA